MRILDIPRDDRFRNVQLHFKRDKPSSYARRRAARAYPGVMQRASGKDGPSREQLEFAVWVKDVVDAYAAPPRKWSFSQLARESKVHRNNIYDWLNAKAFPQSETLKRFCDNLGLDYAEPARIIGWSAPEKPEVFRDPEGFIKRAREMAEHEDTPEEERIILLARIEAAEMHLKNARDSERRFEELMRGVFEDEKDAPGQ